MPALLIDLKGQQFGYLTVVKRVPCKGRPRWECRCVCGSKLERDGQELRRKTASSKTSCGCRRSEAVVAGRGSHGMTGHPAWQAWASMRARCSNPNHQFWHRYGGRGIKVCKRWESFEYFWQDMQSTWQQGLSLGRRNNDNGYSPRNCRWETQLQQTNNTMKTRFIRTPKGRMSISQAARTYGLNMTTLRYRVEKGWKGARLLASTT